MSRAGLEILGRLEHQPGLSQKNRAEIGETEPVTIARLLDHLGVRSPPAYGPAMLSK